MYNIGDRVVYPLHGAGIIKNIENKIILGIESQYYILSVPCSGLDIMIPVEKSDVVGIRPIVGEKEIGEVEAILWERPETIDANWSKRYRDNLEILKNGKIQDVARVVRDLTLLEWKKPLSTGEKKMLTNATAILSSEISCIKNMELDEVKGWITKFIFHSIKR